MTQRRMPAAVWLFILAGLTFLALSLMYRDGPASPYWWGELMLYALMAAGLASGGFNLSPSRRTAAVVYIALCWAFGMVYELSLTVDGTGLGGVHPDTRASFLLAQPDYLMIAAVALWLVRRWHLGFAGAFWIACGKSLTEGLLFSGALTAAILSPAWPFAPLMLAYYALAYSTFVALPLLVLAPETLWSDKPTTPPGALRLIAAGFVLAFVIRLIWGLVFGPLIAWAFNLPPNPLG